MSENNLEPSEFDIQEPGPTTFTEKHPFVVYSALRFGLLVIAGAICFALGARGILLVLLAFVVSGLASFILLVPQRDRVGQRVGGYFRGLNDKIDEKSRAEDDLVDTHAAENELDESTADRK